MLRRGTLNTSTKMQGLNSLRRCGHWHLKEFWVLCLNQPVFIYFEVFGTYAR